MYYVYYHIWSAWTIPTYRVCQLNDYIICVHMTMYHCKALYSKLVFTYMSVCLHVHAYPHLLRLIIVNRIKGVTP